MAMNSGSIHTTARSNKLPRLSPFAALLVLGLLTTQPLPACGPGNGLDEPAAKRVAPDEIEAVEFAGVRIDVPHWSRDLGMQQDGGYLRASDPESGEQLWLLQVYVTCYDDNMERDVRDVFITSIQPIEGGNELWVQDENGRNFRVDVLTRTVTPE